MKQRLFYFFTFLLFLFSALALTLLAQQKNHLVNIEADLFEKEMSLALTQKEVRQKEQYERELREEIRSVNEVEQRPMLAFLTFDDGPSSVTEGVLDILKEKSVPAVFFINGVNVRRGNKALLARAISEGHVIGNHTFSHQYKTIYTTPQGFMDDLERNEKLIMDLTDTRSMLVRFPGGSLNSHSLTPEGEVVINQIKEKLRRLGYIYSDWNVAVSGDNPQEMVSQVESQLYGRERVTILLHDRGDREVLLKALPLLIDKLQEEGYTFALLDPSRDMVQF